MARIKLRRDTITNWANENPILAEGEPSYVLDTGLIKIGNGVDHWLDLPYFNNPEAVFDSIYTDIVPSEDSTFNLGSPTKQWKSLYVSTNTIYINNIPITVNTETNVLVVGTEGTQVNVASEEWVTEFIQTTDNLPIATTSTLGAVKVGANLSIDENGVLNADPNPDVSNFITQEVDAIFSTSTAGSITATDVTNWNTAYSWGDHSQAGYLTQGDGVGIDGSYTPSTPADWLGSPTVGTLSAGLDELASRVKTVETAEPTGNIRFTNNLIHDTNGIEAGINLNSNAPAVKMYADSNYNWYVNAGPANWADIAVWETVPGDNIGIISFNNISQYFYDIINDIGRYKNLTISIDGGAAVSITNWSLSGTPGVDASASIYTVTGPEGDSLPITSGFEIVGVFENRFELDVDEGNFGVWLDYKNFYIQTQSDINLYAGDDLRLQGADVVVLRNTSVNDGVDIVTQYNTENQKNWSFRPDGSIALPYLNNIGYNPSYSLNGPTLKLSDDTSQQLIITGPTPDQYNINAQRLVIQGQKGFGGDSTAGEGGDVYIWAGVGGAYTEGTPTPGNGGDVKVRGGAGQNGGDGGYVKIEGGDSFYGPDGSGGNVEISAGDRVDSGNGDGGDVTIRAGRGLGTGNNGQIYLQTGQNSQHTWQFDNGGNLTIPGNIESENSISVAAGDAVNITSNNTVSAKTWNFDENGVLHLPDAGDIVDSNGNSVLSSVADTSVWVQTFASDTLGDNVISANSVEYDSDGNVVALFSHDDTNNNERYISVAKFDTSGNKLWQQRFAAGQYSDGWGLAVDSTAIYIAGELNGIGSPAEYQTSSLMKLNTANGDVIWMQSYDFGDESNSTVVDVASDGNPVMVGHAYSGGQAFVTTTKIDKDTGNIVWSRKLDGQNGEYSYGMAVGPAGEIVVIGWMDNLGVVNAAATLYTEPASNANWTQNTGLTAGALTAAVTFTDGVPNFTGIVDGTGNRNVDDLIGTFNGVGFGGTTPADDMTVKVGTVTAGDVYDKMLVVKYDSAGFIQWQKAVEFDAGFDCSGADADIDSDGNIYVCGNYTRPDGAGPWSTAMSLLKLDGNGVKQWSRRVVGDCQEVATSVVVGPDNCLYLSGVTGDAGNSDYTFVVAKYSTSGQVLWQRLLDNITTWTFGSNWFSAGGGSNIAVKNGYVVISGTFGDPGPSAETAFIAQVSGSGSLFATGDWDFKGASFSGILNNTASDITVTVAGKTDSDNGINITTVTQSPITDNSNFLVPTKYVLSTPIGDLTVLNNILRGTGDAYGGNGLNLAPGPNLATDMYFRVRGGDSPTHLHFDTGNNSTYDQYFGDDGKYLKLGNTGTISIGTNGNIWTFGTDGNLTLPNNSQIRVDGNNVEVGGMTNFNVESLGVVNVYTNDGAHQWQFGDDGTTTFPDNELKTSIDNDLSIVTESLPTEPPTTIVISGADFSSVNLTYTKDGDNSIWYPAGYIPGTDPYIEFTGGQYGIFVPGFGQALYVNTGTLNVPSAQWNTNPPLGSVAPTGVYTYPGTYTRAWTFGADGNLTLPGKITSPDLYSNPIVIEGYNTYPASTATISITGSVAGPMINFSWGSNTSRFGPDSSFYFPNNTFYAKTQGTTSSGTLELISNETLAPYAFPNAKLTLYNNYSGGNYAGLYVSGNGGNDYISLQAYTNEWRFKQNGELTFPDGTTQITAFTGVNTNTVIVNRTSTDITVNMPNLAIGESITYILQPYNQSTGGNIYFDFPTTATNKTCIGLVNRIWATDNSSHPEAIGVGSPTIFNWNNTYSVGDPDFITYAKVTFTYLGVFNTDYATWDTEGVIIITGYTP